MHGPCQRVLRAFVLLGVALTFTIGISAQTEKILYSFSRSPRLPKARTEVFRKQDSFPMERTTCMGRV